MRSNANNLMNEQKELAFENAPSSSRNGNYKAVRFNAMKHGILSRLAVLAHEDHVEFNELLAALIDEHKPLGMTERHLVEELATIIWRKRRVLLAEGAKINEGLKIAVDSPETVIPSATPFERGLVDENIDLCNVLDTTPESVAELQKDTGLDLVATQKAAKILRQGGPNAYIKALRALLPDSREWWNERVADDEYPATAEGLTEFIQDKLEPLCFRLVKEAKLTPAIKMQTLGEGMQADQLEKLSRYEIHLDRKFERTLAMLLKLKDLRNV